MGTVKLNPEHSLYFISMYLFIVSSGPRATGVEHDVSVLKTERMSSGMEGRNAA